MAERIYKGNLIYGGKQMMESGKKGNFYIFLTALLWSTGGILIKYVPGNPIAINGARSIIAFLFFWAYRRNIKLHLNKIIVTAAFCLTLTNTLFVAANKLTTAANAIVLQYMAPIFVLLWDSLYRKKAPSKKQTGIVIMAFGGMILFFMDQLDGGKLLGNILAVAAGLCFSGVFFLNSLPESNSEESSMLAFFLSFLISIPFLGDVKNMNMTGLAALAALGVFQVGLAYVLFSKGAKLTSPVSASLIGLLEAILSPLWVLLFYGEKMGRFALLGAVVILFAVIFNIVLAADTKGKNDNSHRGKV